MSKLNILSSLTASQKASFPRSSTDEYELNKVSEKPGVSITVSKWSTARTTIFSMYLLYLLAFAFAISHLLLFQFLDGKLAGKNDAASCSGFLKCATETARSQTYISTLSILLSTVFGITIRMSLAISFTQHLWKILRTSLLKVDTIESFFNIRSNILKLFNVSVFEYGWVLVIISLILYLIPIATSFPPGALTIESINHNFTVPDTVLTFDSTYLGNGSFVDTADFFISTSYIQFDNTSTTYYNNFQQVNAILRRIAVNIALAGQPLTTPSPCGSNCSYSFQFVGPSLKCYGDTKETTFPVTSDIFTIFSGNWSYFQSPFNRLPMGSNSNAKLNITAFRAHSSLSNNSSMPIPTTELALTCIPFRALYTVENTYINNEQTLTYTYNQLAQLKDVDAGLNVDPMIENMFNNTMNSSAYDNTSWVKDNLDWYQNSQLMAIITAMAAVLVGSYSASYEWSVEPQNSTGFWDRSMDIGNNVPSGLGSYLIPYTRLNNAPQNSKGSGQLSGSFPVDLNITEERLNQLLGNLTLSLIPSLGLWNETVNVTKSISQNVFSFSHPINLIVPYFLSLLLALPFLIIGTIALIQNGVPATDGGFIQIISTTRGSPALEQAAAGNCLAGENQSSELRDLKIRYGELVDLQVQVGGTVIRRAGFGTDDEVKPLKKGEKYGVITKKV